MPAGRISLRLSGGDSGEVDSTDALAGGIVIPQAARLSRGLH
jgi:hypothetical protein